MFNHIKNSRKQAGLTQVEVESALGLRSLALRDYESGRLKLPVEVAIKLSKLYKISLNELLGVEAPIDEVQKKSLSLFSGLFIANRSHLVFLDPIIRAYLESNYDILSNRSLFQLLTIEETRSAKNEIALEFAKILCSLAGIDSKVTNEEIENVNFILKEINLESSFKNIKKYLKQPYHIQSSSIKSTHLKHFVIWCLFIFAQTDGKIVESEYIYIDEVAEQLKVNRTNYLFIKSKFIKKEY